MLLPRREPSPNNNSDLHLEVETLEARQMLSTVQIFAAGTTGQEHIELSVAGAVVATYTNVGSGADSGVFQTRTYNSNQDFTANDVRIEFINDLYDPSNGIDRNVRIDAIQIDGVRFETESSGVFSTGTWLPADGIAPGSGRGEFLHANGYFQFSGENEVGSTEIVVNAAGAEGTESFALQIDGQTVQTFDNINTNISSYRHTARGTVTADQIRIVFLNDEFDEARGVDANLIVDDIVVDGIQFETEAANVFSTGTWVDGSIVDGFGRGDTLHANGYFQYASDSVGNRGFVGLGDTQITVDEDSGSVQIEVIRFDGSDGPATVFYQTFAAEATDGADFLGTTNGSVTFADGQTSAFINVPLINDAINESSETFSVSLSRVEGAELNVPRTAIITIVDDETGGGLIAHYRLEETSIGQTVVDSSGNGNSGIHRNITSPSGPTTDVPDTDTNNSRGVNFDGVDDFIEIENDSSLELGSGTFTQSVWIRPEESNRVFQGVLGFQPTNGTANRYPGIWVHDGDRIHAGFGDGNNWNSFNTESVLTVGEWNHVATTYNGVSYTAYVNGVEVFSTDQFAGRAPVLSGQITIGRVDNFFEGGIDDVRIYDRALSFVEVVDLIDGATLPNVPLTGELITNRLANGFDTPIEVEFLPDGRMLVVEQAGLIRIVNTNGSIANDPLLDIRSIVNAGTKDRGLIGFAVHPDFENNPFIYVAYTYDPPETAGLSGLAGRDGNGARVSRVSRFTVNAAGTFADPNSESVLVGGNSTFENIGDPSIRPGAGDPHSCFDASGGHLQDCIPADETSHTIGELEFGPDGNLYIASGDGGAFGRAEIINERALDPDSLAGKILRIDPITGQGLSDNPFFDGSLTSNRSKVFAVGLRNPFRFATSGTVDNPTVYIGDVGWTQYEEINVARGGENFGWPAFEGGEDGESFRTGRYEDLLRDYYATNPDVTAPTWARTHSDGAQAIVLGDFASSRYGDLAGTLIFTDIGDQVLRAARLNSAGEVVSVDIVSQSLGFIVDFETHTDGFMYYVDITGSVGRLELA